MVYFFATVLWFVISSYWIYSGRTELGYISIGIALMYSLCGLITKEVEELKKEIKSLKEKL